MKINGIIFISGFIVAIMAGYLFFSGGENSTASGSDATPAEQTGDPDNEAASKEGDTTVPDEAQVFSRNNCLSCHAIEGAGIKGGTAGPDLSQAYNEVEGKHGKSLNEFLQDPPSAVMSTVIGDNPLTDEERKKIIESLRKIAEK